MSVLDDHLVILSKKDKDLPEKYRVMLARNNSIIKDTLSKLWKLTNIVRDRALINYQVDLKMSPSKLIPSK
jgi:hypothetical protein